MKKLKRGEKMFLLKSSLGTLSERRDSFYDFFQEMKTER